jgi:DNA-binding NarL/FixJ family response regulator
MCSHPDVDLILLDLNLPDRDGLTVLSELRKSHPAISVVVMSARQDRDSAENDLACDRFRDEPERALVERLDRAVQLVISGGVYIPPQALPGKEQAPSAPAGMPAARRAVLPYRPNRQLSG